MATEYSVEVCKKLEKDFYETRLHRPKRIARYDAGDELTYNVTAVGTQITGRVHLIVDKFVGGGFAGQVYKVKILNIETDGVPIEGLEVGRFYAMKILIPSSGFSCLFNGTV